MKAYSGKDKQVSSHRYSPRVKNLSTTRSLVARVNNYIHGEISKFRVNGPDFLIFDSLNTSKNSCRFSARFLISEKGVEQREARDMEEKNRVGSQASRDI